MKRNAKGFTLLEILLVMVLISVSAVAVVMSLPDSQQDKTENSARAFYQRLILLQEESLLSGVTYGLHIDENRHQYSWGQLTAEGWQPLSHSRIKPEQKLDGIALALTMGSEELDSSSQWLDQSLFEEEDLFEESRFEQEKKPVFPQPQIWLSASGETTPARVLFFAPNQSPDESNNWRVSILDNGETYLLQPKQSLEDIHAG